MVGVLGEVRGACPGDVLVGDQGVTFWVVPQEALLVVVEVVTSLGVNLVEVLKQSIEVKH